MQDCYRFRILTQATIQTCTNTPHPSTKLAFLCLSQRSLKVYCAQSSTTQPHHYHCSPNISHDATHADDSPIHNHSASMMPQLANSFMPTSTGSRYRCTSTNTHTPHPKLAPCHCQTLSSSWGIGYLSTNIKTTHRQHIVRDTHRALLLLASILVTQHSASIPSSTDDVIIGQ